MYTLSMFNTGQITLPKAWREKFKTNKFVAEETDKGLLIKPLEKDDITYYEDNESFGIYCEGGLDSKKIMNSIKKLNESDK